VQRLRQDGYVATSVEEIADRAKVSKPIVYGEAAIALDAEINRIKLDAGRWE
jgi:hypothetical protein